MRFESRGVARHRLSHGLGHLRQRRHKVVGSKRLSAEIGKVDDPAWVDEHG